MLFQSLYDFNLYYFSEHVVSVSLLFQCLCYFLRVCYFSLSIISVWDDLLRLQTTSSVHCSDDFIYHMKSIIFFFSLPLFFNLSNFFMQNIIIWSTFNIMLMNMEFISGVGQNILLSWVQYKDILCYSMNSISPTETWNFIYDILQCFPHRPRMLLERFGSINIK